MTSDAAVRVIRIAVVYFAVEDVMPPAGPGGRISAVAIAEGRIVHHVELIDVALLRCGKFREATRLRIERRRSESKRPIQTVPEKSVEWQPPRPLQYGRHTSEAEIR